MGELSLTPQDAEMLSEALELLLHRVEGIEDLGQRQVAICSLLAEVRAMSGIGLPQAVLSIRKALNEIANEIAAESDSSTPNPQF
jgi:hypothetical protein